MLRKNFFNIIIYPLYIYLKYIPIFENLGLEISFCLKIIPYLGPFVCLFFVLDLMSSLASYQIKDSGHF